jgi:hypothetical protein
MKEQNNYPWLSVDGHESKKYYYIPEPTKALEFGFFRLEDTGEVFKVTGTKPMVQPMCLEFEKNTDNLIYQGEMPVAKVVKK